MATLQEVISDIDGFLSRGKGSKINLAVAYLRAINEADAADQPQALRYLSENVDSAESTEQVEAPIVIGDNEGKMLEARFGPTFLEMLNSLVQQNLQVDQFYAELWACINSSFFKDEKGRAVALKRVLSDKRIPYFAVDEDGSEMSNQEFKRIRKCIYEHEARVRFLLSYQFSQKTEQADLLLRELDKVVGEERIVLMALLVREAQSTNPELSLLLSRLAGATR